MFEEYGSTGCYLHGHHAVEMGQLAPDQRSGGQALQRQTIFQSYADILPAAVIAGFLWNRRGESDMDKKETVGIFPEKFLLISDKLELDYRLIMLLYDKEHLSAEERVNRAFRYDRQEEKRKPGDEIFFSFLYGGIDFLYERLVKGSTSTEEDIERTYDFIQEFSQMTAPEMTSNEAIYELCREASL